ncbi:type II toxin-antitoxin system HipA family toxin [Teredinibacter turnerae]|uniref:type II toxin-antitoxin system HipA family toxin n=1 Tax=Teredinibacter turnerae TaxID=2426 RepID=UPI00037E88DC|nr:type II toxin-antitoxin system HipA family toxin [Teredinibacter turnerae]
MVQRVNSAAVVLWGVEIGAISWDDERELGIFQYAPEFLDSGVQVSPLMMPLAPQPYSFPALNGETFKRLPGLLADVLPDKFGTAMIEQWLLQQGIASHSFSPVERLCYIGNRGMGALEFKPVADRNLPATSRALDVADMVALASRILNSRQALTAELKNGDDELNERSLADILHVGSSAGGARAKAVVAWNRETNEVRSGQVALPPAFEHWLIKFDGVANNRDKELADGRGYGKMEYAYYKMALSAGIDISECRLLEENGRHHFMTRRFDRTRGGGKLHMQSLCALQHYDFNLPGAYSYEQAMATAVELGLGKRAVEQLYVRALFNIMARNQDDHVKNIAFLMDTSGEWRLAPAFDLTFSYNPQGAFTGRHQMTFNGKRDGFTHTDFIDVAQRFTIPKNRAIDFAERVLAAVNTWEAEASAVGVGEESIVARKTLMRTDWAE